MCSSSVCILCMMFSLFILFLCLYLCFFFFFSSRRRHTRCLSDWSSDVCSSDLPAGPSFDKLNQPVPANGISPQDYSGNFGEFLKARPKEKPFCFWMGFHEPHRDRKSVV